MPTGAGNTAPTLLVKDASLKIKTKYAKTYRISEIIAEFGVKSIASTLWNDDSIPEEGEFVADIALQVGETGWQIRTIYFS